MVLKPHPAVENGGGSGLQMRTQAIPENGGGNSGDMDRTMAVGENGGGGGNRPSPPPRRALDKAPPLRYRDLVRQ